MEQNRVLAFQTGRVFSDEELLEIQGGIAAVNCKAGEIQTVTVCAPGKECPKDKCDAA